jgi:hypothetical protein
MGETREHIKTRMLKNAARIWGYSETEAENNFDPLVAMLLGACATELEKISDEIQVSRARVLERLVQLLSPDVLTGPLPAHAIACAPSIENTTVLEEDAQFYTRIKASTEHENQEPASKDIYFAPTYAFSLNKASVKFMATGDQLFKMNYCINKEIIAHGSGKELSPSTLWLGIDDPGINLHNSLFYFDFRNEADKSFFLHQLPKAKWFFNDLLLKHLPGYGKKEISGENIDIENILYHDYDVSNKIKKHVNAFYKPYFISMLDEEGITTGNERNVIPDEILSAFKGKETELLLQQPLRWIRIKFPDTISNRLLQDVVCVMNCFPVVNHRAHEINYRLQEIINIIPLNTDDLFLDVQEVSDDEGNILNIRPLQQDSNESLAMLMRNGGIGRFDERNAAAIVDYLLQLLRDETAAFSILGSDFISSEIKQMQQVINKLEQRLFSRQIHREQIPYLFIRNNAKQQWKNVFIKYWSTNGQEGNNIKAGSRLQLYKGGSVNGSKAQLISTTIGGRNKLNTTEGILAYKSALLSKDRLSTVEDIKTFCFYQLGNRLDKVEIKRGTMIHPDEVQGYIKTTDIFIYLHKKSYNELAEKNELSFWRDNLKLLLEAKSAAFTQYRVFIK